MRLEAAGFDTKTGPVPAAVESFVGWVNSHFPIALKVAEFDGKDGKARARAGGRSGSRRPMRSRSRSRCPRRSAALERYVVINAIDHHWQEHLTEMEELRRSIGLRSYGQKDPLQEYKGEAYRYFEELMNNVRLQICTGLFRSTTNLQAFENMLSILSRSARLQGPETGPRTGPRPAATGAGSARPRRGRRRAASAASRCPCRKRKRPDAPPAEPEVQLPRVTVRRETPKVGRNDPVPAAAARNTSTATGSESSAAGGRFINLLAWL